MKSGEYQHFKQGAQEKPTKRKRARKVKRLQAAPKKCRFIEIKKAENLQKKLVTNVKCQRKGSEIWTENFPLDITIRRLLVPIVRVVGI